MATLLSDKASHKSWSIVPFVVNVILVNPPSRVYHIESKFGSLISTLKLGAVIPYRSSGEGEFIAIAGIMLSLLIVTSVELILPNVSLA